MKLRRHHKKIEDNDFIDELDKPEELENVLSTIGNKILKIKEMNIYELKKIFRKEKNNKRTLKRSK